MDQIRADQIIQATDKEQNKYFAPPRDLVVSTKEAVESSPVAKEQEDVSAGVSTPPTGGSDYGENLNDAVQPPATPAILGVKEQRVNIADDGTITIDVVLDVQNIPGITEYDIRVAKDAGNL